MHVGIEENLHLTWDEDRCGFEFFVNAMVEAIQHELLNDWFDSTVFGELLVERLHNIAQHICSAMHPVISKLVK